MSETTPLKVFCSHASPDKPAVKDFAERLRRTRGIDAWVDEWEIAPGDNIVTRINEGLAASDAGLIFFSHHTADSRWVSEEVASLIYRLIVDGRPLIPVMIDDDAIIPELIRPRARRGITEFDAIADALLGRSGKPALGPTPPAERHRRLALSLVPEGEDYRFSATLDDDPLDAPARLTPDPRLPESYTSFVESRLSGVIRDSAASAALAAVERELETLGRMLGQLLFPGPVGEQLQQLLDRHAPGEWLELRLDSAEPRVLALPVEAARLPGGPCRWCSCPPATARWWARIIWASPRDC